MRVRIGNSSIGGRVNIKSRLPAGYQEVEYIESPNAEYIDTGKTADSTSIIAFDFQYVSFNSSYNRIFGARNNEGKGLLNIRTSTTSGPYLLVENVYNWVSTTSIGTNKHSIKMNGVNHNLYYDGSTVAPNFSILDSTLGNMWLFGTNQGGTNSNVRIFNYSHIKGGKLIQKLVPCVRLSDNKPGMYDIVNDNFLVNSGTGEFVVGPNVPKGVLPDEYQRVEYVEGTGTQYIDTGIKFIKGPYKMDFKFYRNDNSGKDMSIFGQRTLGKFVNTYSTYYETVFGTTTAGTLLLNQDIHMVIDSNSGIYQNGTKILNNYNNNDRSSDYSAFMFAFHENVEKAPQWFLKGRIYYYTIEEAGVVTHNFLPCYRKSDGEIGMYDVITKQFFTNQGTGTFLKGSNVVNNIVGKIAGGSSDTYYGYNQMVQNGDMTDGETGWYKVLIDLSFDNNIMTATWSASNGRLRQTNVVTQENHKYLGLCQVCSSLSRTFRMELSRGWTSGATELTANVWTDVAQFINPPASATDANSYFQIYLSSGTVPYTLQLKNIMVIDLTDWFGAGKEPSTVEEFKAKFIKDYYGYCPTAIKLTQRQINSEPVYGYNQIANRISSSSDTAGFSWSWDNNLFTFTASNPQRIYFNPFSAQNIIQYHKYFISANILTNSNNIPFRFGCLNTNPAIFNMTKGLYEKIIECNNGKSSSIGFADFTVGQNIGTISGYFMVIDLTDWYGEGNEPTTVEEFRTTFPNLYYPYSKKRLLNRYMINKLIN